MRWPPPGHITTAGDGSAAALAFDAGNRSSVGVDTLPSRITRLPATSPPSGPVVSASGGRSSVSPGGPAWPYRGDFSRVRDEADRKN